MFFSLYTLQNRFNTVVNTCELTYSVFMDLLKHFVSLLRVIPNSMTFSFFFNDESFF